MPIDQSSVESAVQQYYRELFWFCYARMLNKQDVEDVVQSVFALLQEKSGELSPEHIRAWLYSVAQKKLLEEQRDAIRRSRFVSYDTEVIAKDPLLIHEIVEESIAESEVDALKARILQKLTPQERELFEAIYEKHINRKELAEQYRITENALNVRVHRLKNRIKALTKALMTVMLFVFVKCR